MEKQNLGFLLVLIFGLAATGAWFLQPISANSPPPPPAQLRTPNAQPNPAQANTTAAGQDQVEGEQRGARAQAAGQGRNPPGSTPRGNNTAVLREATLRVTQQFAEDKELSSEDADALLAVVTQLLDDSQVLYDAAQADPNSDRSVTRNEMRALRGAAEENLVELMGIDQTAEFLGKLQRR